MNKLSKWVGAAESAAVFFKERLRPGPIQVLLVAASLLLAGLACQAIQGDPETAQIVIQISATPEVVVADTELPETTATEAPVTGSLEDVRIQSWDIGSELDPEVFELMDPKDQFRPDETIYVTLWTVNHSSSELPYEAYWFDPNGMEVLREVSTISPGETGWYLSGDPPPGGWESGEYSIELEVNGQLVESWSFQVTSEEPGEQPPDEEEREPDLEPEPDRESVFIDPLDRDTGNWENCEYCDWQDGQLTVGPWPISGAYFQHNIICLECGTPRYYRMAVDVLYEEGPSERGFGFLMKWNDDIMITAEVTPWQTLMVWQYEHATEEWTMLQGDFYGAVKPGRQVNRLEVEVIPGAVSGKATYAVGVNGRKQIVLEGQSSSEGLVGLTLFGHATAASFDNFEFEPLDPEAGEGSEGNGGVSG